MALPEDLKLRFEIKENPKDNSPAKVNILPSTIIPPNAEPSFSPEEYDGIKNTLMLANIPYEYPVDAASIFGPGNKIKTEARLYSPFRVTIRTSEGLNNLVKLFGENQYEGDNPDESLVKIVTDLKEAFEKIRARKTSVGEPTP